MTEIPLQYRIPPGSLFSSFSPADGYLSEYTDTPFDSPPCIVSHRRREHSQALDSKKKKKQVQGGINLKVLKLFIDCVFCWLFLGLSFWKCAACRQLWEGTVQPPPPPPPVRQYLMMKTARAYKQPQARSTSRKQCKFYCCGPDRCEQRATRARRTVRDARRVVCGVSIHPPPQV